MDIVAFFLNFLCSFSFTYVNDIITCITNQFFFVSNKVYDGQTTDLHCVPLISFSHSH